MIFQNCVSQFYQYGEEDGIIILNDINFDTAIRQFKYILIEFYAPWCNHCHDLAPELIEASYVVQNYDIRIAKVDATTQNKLAQRFQIKTYPTLKYFRNGIEFQYDGRRTASQIIEWLKIKSVPLIKELQNIKEVYQFQIFIFYFFNYYKLDLYKQAQNIILVYIRNGKQYHDDYKVFQDQAHKFEGVFFATIDQSQIKPLLNLQDQNQSKIALFTTYFKDPVIFNGEPSKEKLQEFINAHSYPYVLSFNKREVHYIENLQNPCIILLLDSDENSVEEILFRSLAPEFRNKISFASLNKQNPIERQNYIKNKISDTLGSKQFPSVFIYDTTKKPPIKYKLEQNISEESIRQFIQGWMNQEIQPYYKSQKIPIQRGLVKEIVGKSFELEVLDTSKSVFLMIYSSWDQNSKKMMPFLKTIAYDLQTDQNIVIAQFDASENEVEGLVVKIYPTFVLFNKINGQLEIIDYEGDRTVSGIEQFIKENIQKSMDIKNVSNDL